MEIGGDEINFLDFTSSIDAHSYHKFSIFRKETTTDTIINGLSIYLMVRKLAALNSRIYRLLHLFLDIQEFNKEIPFWSA